MISSRPFHYDLELVFRRSLEPAKRRLLRLGAICQFGLMICAAMLLRLRNTAEPHIFDSVGWPIFLVFFAPVYLSLRYFANVRQLRTAIKDPKNRYEAERKVEFDDEILRWTFAAGGVSELPWNEMLGQERHGSTSLVWISGQHALFVPDSAWSEQNLPIWRAKIDSLPTFAR